MLRAICIALLGIVFTVSVAVASPHSLQPAKAQWLRLELENLGNTVRVTLFNASTSTFAVDKRLSYGSETNWTELNLVVQEENGKKRDFITKTMTLPPDEEDWCSLSPRQYVGREITLRQIQEDYGLEMGTYVLSAEYLIRSDSGRVVGRVRSAAVTLSVQ